MHEGILRPDLAIIIDTLVDTVLERVAKDGNRSHKEVFGRKEFAPPDKLVGAYYRNELSWEDFERKYLEFLRSAEMKPKIESFAKRCTEETITLICIEDTADKCHRRLLAEELQKYQPHLKIFHK